MRTDQKEGYAMKKITFAILGMGNRGTAYAAKQLKYPEEMEVVAMADKRRIRLDAANKYLHLPENCLYDSAEAILSQPKLADVMVIATQDAQHKEHALRAMEIGYDLLLEKPISNKLEDITVIAKAAEKLGRKVFVCHVLRYTVFYQQIKKLIEQGVIGKVESVEAAEHVGCHHYAHSFVRGNWHNEAASSPMILAKCCHDMDIVLWLTGKNCLKVNSSALWITSRRRIALRRPPSAAWIVRCLVPSMPTVTMRPGSPAGPPISFIRSPPRRTSPKYWLLPTTVSASLKWTMMWWTTRPYICCWRTA